MHALVHILGLDNGSGYWYLWWSGAAADISELAILGGLISVYRRHNCEIVRCLRLGRHKTAAGHLLCRRHHPDGHLTVEQAHAAHREAQR